MTDLVIAEYEEIANVADAIRSKTGKTEQMSLSQMATNVMSISSSDIIIDSELSETSTNPVQNKVVTEKINELEENIVTSWNDLEDRPFYEGEPEIHYNLPEMTISNVDELSMGFSYITGTLSMEDGKTYEVIINGNVYTAKCVQLDSSGFTLGDKNLQEYPFYFLDRGIIYQVKYGVQEAPITIAVRTTTNSIKKLERKFVDGIVGMDVEGKTFTYNDRDYVAYNGAEIFNDYLTNMALGAYSHAEGERTNALGFASHAEGGVTVAYGMQSHAEGLGTEAYGTDSHAEGWCTIASGEAQHVQGQFNIEDTESKYAHIVGNGENTYNEGEKRSNAHTLDWDGNAWYQGDVFVGSTSGTNKDEGSKKLATEEYVNTEVANLINSAPETLDTIGELAVAFQENSDIIEVLNESITNKADKSEIAQPNWSQNDETALDYIKNRPFYSTGEYEEIELLKDEIAYKIKTYYILMNFPSLQENHTYKLIFNNEEFICTAILDADNKFGLGNSDYLNNNTWENGKESFYLQSNGVMAFVYKKDSSLASFNVSVYEVKEKIHQIEKKYIENHLVGHKAINQKYIYNDITYVSEDGAEIFNNLSNIAIGQNSHAEGSGTVAFGEFSHAEGLGSQAFGSSSHAGGASSEAYGTNSFAHGTGCIASGNRAWAQNQSTDAFGDDSHAEGLGTIANRGVQHVQGSYNIPEDRVYQKYIFTMNSNSPTYDGETIVYLLDKVPTFNKVDGKYTTTGSTTPVAYKDLQPENVFLFEDTTETLINKYYFVKELLETKDGEEGVTLYQWNLFEYKSRENREKGKYVHIVGNGTSNTERSNAHTLDWDGNAEFAGDVKVNACGGEKPISLIALSEEISELQSALIGVSDIIGGE